MAQPLVQLAYMLFSLGYIKVTLQLDRFYFAGVLMTYKGKLLSG